MRDYNCEHHWVRYVDVEIESLKGWAKCDKCGEIIEFAPAPIIHYANNGGQKGDAHIACTQEWTEIDWKQPPNLPEEVYLAGNGMPISFDRTKATCRDCLTR